MSTFEYDLLVVGGGSGGQTAAKMAKGLGKKVVIVEKDKLGGECTWTGCVPSKALIKAAEVAHMYRHGEQFGLKNAVVDNSNVMPYVRRIIQDLYQTETPEVFAQEGIDTLFGDGSFIDAHQFQLKDRIITFDKAIIASGSSPTVPPIDGIEAIPYLTNHNLFDIEQLPRSIIILGGGAIGAEMASALNRLGVQVTVIEMNKQILPREDVELVTILTDSMHKEGIKIKTGLHATQVQEQDGAIAVTAQDAQGNQIQIRADRLLVAVGRKPNIEGLHLDRVGVVYDKKRIVVNDCLQTSTNNIFACGDVVGPYQFSHMAWYQATVATRNAFIPLIKKRVDYRNVIWATFTAPELASAGLTEQQAREKHGDKIKIYRTPYTATDRPQIDQATTGMVKVITDTKGQMLGVHILGERAAEIVHELQLAKTKGIRLADIASVIHAYPTYAELVWRTAQNAYIEQLKQNLFVKFYQWIKS